VAQGGCQESAETDNRRGADAQMAVREHRHVPAAPHHQRQQRIDQCQDSAREVHSRGVSEQTELRSRHLLRGVGFGGSVCFRKRVLLGCHRQNRDKTLALSSLGFVSNEKQIPQAIEKLKRGDVSKETLETIELRPRHVRS